MNDKQVKEKMERLDALSGGVVFGKEEAWDKLQARMNAKPARKIILWYRLAAAAILLLCISIAALYYTTPKKQIAATQPQPAVIQNSMPEPEQIPVTTTVLAGPEKTIVRTPNNFGKEQPIKTVVRKQQAPPPAQFVDTATTKSAIAVVTQPMPAKPLVKKLRVVHINELGNMQDEGLAYASGYSGPSLDIRKMKVVSIYDIAPKGIQPNEFTRIPLPDATLLVLTNSSRNRNYNQPFSHNPLTIRFSRNN